MHDVARPRRVRKAQGVTGFVALQALRLPYELKQFSWQGSGAAAAQPEATEEEWRAAVAEATQQLQDLVCSLNRRLQSLRDAMHAIAEEAGEG